MDYNNIEKIDNNNANLNFQQPRLTTMLNVLTILTLVYSGFQLFTSVGTYKNACRSIDTQLEQFDKLAESSKMGQQLSEMMYTMLQASCDNKLLILITTIVSCMLCIFGALMMRKLKRQGLAMYVGGELLYPVMSIIVFAKGSFASLIGVSQFIFPIIFIALYFSQKKHLTQ